MNRLLICFLLIITSVALGQKISPRGYYTEGTKVYDENHNPVHFLGVNRPSLEWMAKGKYLVENDFRKMAECGVNIVRLPLNPYYWQNNTSGYRSSIDDVVHWCMKYNMNIILDLHRAQRGNKNSDPDDIFEMADEHSLVFWKEVASKYKDNGKVLFELYNEPHRVDWNIIVDGGMHNGWKAVGYQELYDTVRAAGAHNLVIIGGKHWTYDLRYYETHPIDGYNIMYAAHCYPHSDKQPEHWYQWTNIARQYPVIMTEFGPKTGSFYDLSYVEELADTMKALGVHWTAWAWWHTFGNNSLWSKSGFYPETDTYESTDYGKWVLEKLKEDSPVHIGEPFIAEEVAGFDVIRTITKNSLHLTLKSDHFQSLSIFDMSGKELIKKANINKKSYRLSTEKVSFGMYLCKVRLKSGEVKSFSFIKGE